MVDRHRAHVGSQRHLGIGPVPLQWNGAARDQIEAVSYGEERPADRGESEASYQRNRRVELILD